MRKALVVGINYYEKLTPLFGCVKDAHAVRSVLARNSDSSVNFDVNMLTGTDPAWGLTRANLKDGVTGLFEGDSEVALFYFSGHGHLETTGGYLCGSDSGRGDDGLALSEVLKLANSSLARNKVVVLDSCHSGVAGNSSLAERTAELTEGLSILTASTADQYASEENGRGVFTTLFCDALDGAASNLVGEVTPGSIYAHIDQSLGSWEQRPVFKTNVKNFVSLRKVNAPISLKELRRIAELFPGKQIEIQLDPTFEPERHPGDEALPPPDPDNTKTFAVLQNYNRVNLVRPVGVQHMWHAAMNSKVCKLTVLGEHYRRLVVANRI